MSDPVCLELNLELDCEWEPEAGPPVCPVQQAAPAIQTTPMIQTTPISRKDAGRTLKLLNMKMRGANPRGDGRRLYYAHLPVTWRNDVRPGLWIVPYMRHVIHDAVCRADYSLSVQATAITKRLLLDMARDKEALAVVESDMARALALLAAKDAKNAFETWVAMCETLHPTPEDLRSEWCRVRGR
jgi:hypothetical protein